MSDLDRLPVEANRAIMALLGSGAGLALWELGDRWDDPGLPMWLYLALLVFVVSYSAVTLALCGPVAPLRALVGAAVIAVPVTALVSLAALRHLVGMTVLEDPVVMPMAALLVVVATPFLSVWLCDRQAWRQYPLLFDTAWSIVVRYALAWAFVGLVVLILFLSDALLDLVGVGIIGSLLRSSLAMSLFVGATLGLALAVVYEMRDRISPFLVLRLLRLLVPVVVFVFAVFLAAIPLRGLSDLFGNLSAGGTLMGAAFLGVTLVAVAVDRDRAHEVRHPLMRSATQVLAVLLPILTALAVWAVYVRVRQYGWTPERLMAGMLAGVLMAHGASDALAVLRRGDWPDRIRQANVVLALSVIVLAVLWMTPVLDADRITVKSQIARYQAGQVALDDLALWEMEHDWGRAGQRGLAQLEAMTERADHAALVERIAEARDADARWSYYAPEDEETRARRADELLAGLALRPVGAQLSLEMLGDVPPYWLNEWVAGCNRALPDGREGCVLVLAPFVPVEGAGQQGMLFYHTPGGRAMVSYIEMRPKQELFARNASDLVRRSGAQMDVSVIAQVLDGDFQLTPFGLTLRIGDAVLVPDF